MQYIKEGRIKLDRSRFQGPATYHDPCNYGRKAQRRFGHGFFEEPRWILDQCMENWVDLYPCAKGQFCCGGGGGLASTGAFGKVRSNAGKRKAEQIRQTGAKIVVTNCFNCLTQIRDLIKTYDLGVEVKSIVELVSESLVAE